VPRPEGRLVRPAGEEEEAGAGLEDLEPEEPRRRLDEPGPVLEGRAHLCLGLIPHRKDGDRHDHVRLRMERPCPARGTVSTGWRRPASVLSTARRRAVGTIEDARPATAG